MVTRLLDVDINLTEALNSGGEDALTCFGDAMENLDAIFGRGYAKEHPELIAAYVQASVVGAQTTVLLRGLEAIAEEVRALSGALVPSKDQPDQGDPQ